MHSIDFFCLNLQKKPLRKLSAAMSGDRLFHIILHIFLIMKKLFITFLSIVCIAALGACKNENSGTKDPAEKKVVSSKSVKELPNYRYVDIDTVLAKYNLAKDYTEEMLRMQSNLESEAKRHENSIKSFASSMENKYKNNQYTEQTYNADQQRMQQMQTNAASALDKLQRSSAEAAMAGEKVVQDSIHAFIEKYNASHHYDAIFLKAATLYIDPALDITEEVIEGLNARYNKKEKK